MHPIRISISLALVFILPFIASAQVVQKKGAVKRETVALKLKSTEASKMTAATKEENKQQTGKHIDFVETVHEFGTVNEGDAVKHTFEFVNRGTEDIKIDAVKTSCGCTAAKHSKKTLKPGDAGFVSVEFNTKKKGGIQFKTITVNYGGDKPAVLYLKGEVINQSGNTGKD